MQMPCPCKGSRPALVAAVVRALMKAGLVRGRCVFLYRYAKSGPFRGGWLTRRWWARAFSGSVLPFCFDHDTLSPWMEVLVRGSWKAVL